MALACTAPHLSYVKKKRDQLKDGKVANMTFCLVRKKGTNEVIIHFDKASVPASKYKNPATIHRVFKKTAQFRYQDSDFFDDISKLISVAGKVSVLEDGKFSFVQEGSGRAGLADLKIACLDLKLKAPAFGKTVEINDGNAVNQQPPQQRLAAFNLDSINAVASNPLGTFASLDALSDLLEAVNSVEGGSALFKMQRDALNKIYNQIEDWSSDGIDGVTDAMEVIGSIESFADEEADLRAFEQANIQQMEAEIQGLKEDTRSLLSEKGFGTQFNRVRHFRKLLVTLKEGHYLLIPIIKPLYGGGSLLLVDRNGNFDNKGTFGDLNALLEEIALDKVIHRGQFHKSKSKKKIAFTGNPTRLEFRAAINSMGLPMTVYKVQNFGNLQQELQRQRAAVTRNESVLAIKAQLMAGDAQVPTWSTMVTDGAHEEVLKAFYSYLKKEVGSESLAYVLCVKQKTKLLGELDKDAVQSEWDDIYKHYIKNVVINIRGTNKSQIDALYAADPRNEDACVAKLKQIADSDPMLTNLLNTRHGLFSTSDYLAGAIYDSPTLGAALGLNN